MDARAWVVRMIVEGGAELDRVSLQSDWINKRLQMNLMPDYVSYTKPKGAKLVGEKVSEE